jgi:hypothetical protein
MGQEELQKKTEKIPQALSSKTTQRKKEKSNVFKREPHIYREEGRVGKAPISSVLKENIETLLQDNS